MNREKFVIGCSIVSAIRNANTMYCAKKEENGEYKDEEYSDEELNEVAKKIKKECSTSMIEDLAIFLQNHCLPIGVAVGDIFVHGVTDHKVKVLGIKQGMIRYGGLDEDIMGYEGGLNMGVNTFLTVFKKVKDVK